MFDLKFVLRGIVLLVMSLWAQSAAAVNDNYGSRRTAEIVFGTPSSATCTVGYTDVNDTSVSHSFTADAFLSRPDLLGRLNPSTVTSGWFEEIAPTATLAGFSGNIGEGSQSVTARFTEAVANFTVSGLRLIRASAANFTMVTPSSDAFDISPLGNGAVSVQILGTGVKDFANSDKTASNMLRAMPDFQSPTPTLSGLPSSVYGGIPRTISVVFDEDVTGFTLADIMVEGGTVANFVVIDAAHYTFEVTPTLGEFFLQLSILPHVAEDLAGNPNTPSGVLSAPNSGPPTPIAASFTVVPDIAAFTPFTAFFTDSTTPTSGESVATWSWDFGDGHTSSVQNAVHNYLTHGTFSVTLTACDPGGCDTANGTVTVSAALGSLNATLSGFSGVINGAQTVTLQVDSQLSTTALGGLTLTDFDTTNLTLSNLVLASAGPLVTDPQTYSFTATPNGGGAVSIGLPAGTVANMAAAQNTVSNTLSGTQNGAPVAGAGPDQVVAPEVLVTLDASGSSDPDTNPLTYSWASPASVTLSDASAEIPSFTAPALNPGDADIVLSFTVTVFDGIATTQDTVLITVRPGVVVTLGGLPAEISGPGNHTVTIAFSRAVTGFTAADIAVSGGVVSSFSGTGASYAAVIAASGSGDLSVSIPAAVATDANSIGNAASNIVAAVNVLGAATSQEIAHFMQTRSNALLANQPDLAGFLRGGAGQFAAEVTRGGGTVAFDSGYDAPIWARMNANWSTDLGAESQYVFGVLGGHSKVSENLLIGGMLQFDHLSETNGAATTQGTGWLIGPYFVAKLPNQPLYFEGSLLYGQTSNTVSPLGTYEDAFSTERWLATLGVSGQIERGRLILLPFLDAKYTSDAQAAYIDGLSNPIAAQTIGLAQASAGLGFELALTAATTLKGGASGVWSYSSGSAIAPGYEGGRARINLGVAHRFSDCNGVELSGFYDGIGAVDFESFGAEFKWQTCF